jgi:fatty acid desaturase
VPFRASEDLGYDAPPLLVLLALIHRSARKMNSANFVFTEFSEVGRSALVTFSTSWRLIHRLVLSWRGTKRQSNRSRRKGNTLGWVVWALMSVMLVCLLLWAATGAVALLFGAVLAGLGVLYVVLLTNL